MSDEIFFDGKRYISANDAAVSSDLTRDYVARLCRDGRVAGRRIGKNWYVDHASLAHFLVTQEFAKSNRNESLTHERIREYHGENVPRPKANTTALSAVASTAPHVSRVISGRADEIKNKMAAAVAGQTRGVLGQTRQFLNTPGGLAHAAFQIVPAQVGTHIPSYTLTPVMEFFHKVVALTTAVMLVFGTYAAVDPAYAQFAANSVRDNISAALDSYHEAMSGGPRAFVARAQLQVAAAAGDPEGTFASIASFLPRTAASLARSFHKSINSAFYTVAFPNSLTQRSIIAVEVTPYANDTKSAVRAEPSTVRPNASGPTTIINNPVVERVVETTRLVSVGGISEEILNKKISELDAKLSAQLSGLAAANSTQVTNVYAAAASVANIDHLKGLDLESGTIRGGTITNTAVSAKSLAVTGTGTSTAANGFDISDGCFAIDGVCISGSGGGSSFGQSWELLGGVLSPTTSVPILVNNATSTITNLVTVNATSTNATTTTFAIGSLTGPLQANSGVVSATSTLSPAYGGTGNSTFAIGDILYASAAGTLSRLSVGSTGQVLKVSAGLPSWGADAQGSGGTGAWATSTDNLLLYPATVSNVVVIGQSATTTTGNILEVAGASLFRGSLVMHGIGTASSFTATSTTASVFPYASSTALTVSGTASTSILRIDNLSSGGLAIRADGQVYSAATSTLSTISGTLALTQLASQAANTVVANLTGGSAAPTAISTTSLFAGTNGQILAFSGGTWTGVATTTFSTGLTYASGNTTCDTASDS
ncbi:helix-turn-helix domain-containing protein, partial [Candidatus Kaiserbacteria bacterium]|nr:helix-turn-helix domain-containing protein [Candidatus Kaiserbacteria bacterium]